MEYLLMSAICATGMHAIVQKQPLAAAPKGTTAVIYSRLLLENMFWELEIYEMCIVASN
jgi:hypothetical protein